jgi:hypothetical protein
MDARSTAAYFVAATDAIPATRLTARHVAVLAPAPGAQNDATERLHRAHRTGALSQADGAWSPAGQRSRSMISSAVAGTIARVIHPSAGDVGGEAGGLAGGGSARS